MNYARKNVTENLSTLPDSPQDGAATLAYSGKVADYILALEAHCIALEQRIEHLERSPVSQESKALDIPAVVDIIKALK